MLQGPSPQQVQTQQYQDQTEARNREQQSYLNQQEEQRKAALASSRASDALGQMINQPGNYQETNGTSINVNNGGGGGAGASRSGTGGVAIGGGVYPDISAQMAQFNKSVPQVPAPGHIAPPVVPSTSGAFAHAKDVAGRQGNRAIDQLANEMSRRGLSDSGMTSMGIADILGGVGRQQADAEYQAANTDNTRQWEANQLGYSGDMNQSQLGYQGGIQQRGQDMSAYLNLLRQLY